ncbi:GAP family protein [Actinomycetospora soli]|uniref:GAP family protein n=1 Tax=Actinomycetospora soli TaxID=2893887 RepID=UPI001E5F523D|nr:GAP family protein [Actinomycetospora soli]MCD2189293.1 GAP family protein [Actinomycetospora soli]
MSPEAIVLGLLSAVRATPLALVSGFLLTRSPARLVTAYLVGGLAVSLPVGIGAVLVFGATANTSESGAGRDVVDVLLGVAALVYAVGYATGRFGRAPDAGPGRFGALTERLRTPTVPVAAAAGVATNLPGLYYLAALVAILETEPGPTEAVLQVLVYNLLRFALPAAALAIVLLRPTQAQRITEAVRAFGVRHRRTLVIAALTVVGVYLVVRGVAGLVSHT